MESQEHKQDFFKKIKHMHLRLTGETSLTYIHNLLKDLYGILSNANRKGAPKISINFKISSPFCLQEDDQDTFFALLQTLLYEFPQKLTAIDSLLLNGTCLSAFVAKVCSTEFTTLFLTSLFCELRSSVDDKPKDMRGSSLEIGRIKELAAQSVKKSESLSRQTSSFTDPHNTITFSEICFLHGVLACQNSHIFLHQSQVFNGTPFLIVLFEPIYYACLVPGSTQYHSFNTLVDWLKLCQKYLMLLFDKNSPITSYFSVVGDIPLRVLSLLESNWENPIKGISGFVKQAYKLLFELHRSECIRLQNADFPLFTFLIEKTASLSWKTKGKYVVLSVLVNFADYRNLLTFFPDLPAEVMINLKANYSSSIISELYKSFVMNIIKSRPPDEAYNEWQQIWKTHIIDALCSSDKLLVQNLTSIILPWTLKTISGAHETMLNDLSEERIAAKLSLLAVAKEVGVYKLSTKDLHLLSKYTHHLDVQLRMKVFSILCCSPKKSETVLKNELEVVKIFITENLNIDSMPFQQLILAQLRVLLVRIRDSVVHLYKKDKHDFDSMQHLFQFIDFLYNLAILNTYPGACYQRRRMSLKIIKTIYEVIVDSFLGFSKKDKPSDAVKQAFDFADLNGLCKLFAIERIMNLLPCFTDYTDEVRTISSELIINYALTFEQDKNEYFWNDDFLMKYAGILCNRLDFRNVDAGAHIFAVILMKSCFETGFNDFGHAHVGHLIKVIKNQLDVAKKDFLLAAMKFPIQGHMLALQYCLEHYKDHFGQTDEDPSLMVDFLLDEVVGVVQSVIRFMLNSMRGGKKEESCPSFCDININLKNLVLEQRASAKELGEITDEEDLTSSDVDLLMSCCWHCIKNGCNVLCAVTDCLLILPVDANVRKEYAETISTAMSAILILCRHRGVVEACSLSLNKFCQSLDINRSLHEETCKNLLNMVFDSLSDASNTSVTRRSAGLPLLCQAVVSSEQNNVQRYLFTFTIESLLKVIPQTPSLDVDDKMDIAQAHAYHILKALVTDASLAQVILMHLNDIVPACISGFSSPLWSVRNGALQLFGVLLPRICGQKKVQDDESEHNLVSSSELFSRCPTLQTYLVQHLHECVQCHREGKLSPELVPILSIIAKLSHCQKDGELETRLKLLLLKLLNIPVWKVRELVASTLSSLVTAEEVCLQLEKCELSLRKNEADSNEVHTVLLIVQKLLKKGDFFSNVPHIIGILKSVYELLLLHGKSPILLGLVLNCICNSNSCLQTISFSELELASISINDIGSTYYETEFICLQLLTFDVTDLPNIIKLCALKNISVQNACLNFLSEKLKIESSKASFYECDSLRNWQNIFVSVIDFTSVDKHCTVIKEALRFITELSNDWNVGSFVFNVKEADLLERNVLILMRNDSSLTVTAFSFKVLSLCIKANIVKKLKLSGVDLISLVRKWSATFHSFCQPRYSDVQRTAAADSVTILGHELILRLQKSTWSGCQDSVDIFIDVCEGVLLLLQDEDENIRNKACYLPSKLSLEHEINAVQFNVGIEIIYKEMYHALNCRTLFEYLWNRIQNFQSPAMVVKAVLGSKNKHLFEQEYVNVFAEPIELLKRERKILERVMEDLLESDCDYLQEKLLMFASDVEAEVKDLLVALNSIEDIEFEIGFTMPHNVFLPIKKLQIQYKLLNNGPIIQAFPQEFSNLTLSIKSTWKEVHKKLSCITSFFLSKL